MNISRLLRWGIPIIVVAVSVVVWVLATRHPSATPEYVGAQACGQCHQAQFDAWKGSHHDLAMQHASGKTVLGDFNSVRYQYNGATSTFFRRDGKFYVNTDGPDGGLQDFEIKYTFGVEPLQQYLVELPGGRLQAPSIAWDSRPTATGGQRWFQLYPQEKIDHKDELHWTRLSQNWNHMCAECHSTHLQKNFDLASNQFRTTWAEINVACESCHGPASRHVDWAGKAYRGDDAHKGLVVQLDERRGVSWNLPANAGTATRSSPRSTS